MGPVSLPSSTSHESSATSGEASICGYGYTASTRSLDRSRRGGRCVSDERLKNDVLARADEDAGLSEQARLVILAALESSEDLSEVLGSGTTRRELVQSLTAPIEEPSEPTGAYLIEVTVEGFRGIGPRVTLPLKPGPGLTVVAGRNGSGKSTLEALELALTGTNSR